jgi:hypothetical protein
LVVDAHGPTRRGGIVIHSRRAGYGAGWSPLQLLDLDSQDAAEVYLEYFPRNRLTKCGTHRYEIRRNEWTRCVGAGAVRAEPNCQTVVDVDIEGIVLVVPLVWQLVDSGCSVWLEEDMAKHDE